ncbi:hypothetical protein [Saccharicrinis sp. 156]|uniref:hypothetical protein n=1 Tax=Saccharicrinis sp. 156 TaxID=3417574 RepID=UPI003D33EBF8
MAKVILTIILGLVTVFVSANSGFTELVNELKTKVQTVQVKSGEFDQGIQETIPGIIQVKSNFINNKGESKTTEFTINLADIDIYMVKEITVKDAIHVQLKVNDGQKFIRVTSDGELLPYVSTAKIMAKDKDNAREISAIIKKMIPLGKEILSTKIDIPSYEDKVSFLQEGVTEVNLPGASFDQKLRTLEGVAGNMSLDVTTTTGKKTDDEQYVFNLADIEENSVMIDVKGNKVQLVFEMKYRKKLVHKVKNGNQVPFVAKVSMLANQVDAARDLSIVLKRCIPQARTKVHESLPSVSEPGQILDMINSRIAELSIDENTYLQAFTNSCLSNFEVTENTPKGTTTSSYQFNFSDIREQSIDYIISGTKMQIGFSTLANQKLIRKEKDGEIEGYSNKLVLICSSSYDAKIIRHLLKKLVEVCKERPNRLIPQTNAKEKLKWLMDHIVEVNVDKKTYVQVLIKSENDPKKIEFKQLISAGSNATEMLYEFNMNDIDSKNINYNITGKSLSVEVNANYNSKVIKTYKNGVVSNYTSKIKIYFDDIEMAKNCMLAFQEIIEESE